MAKTPLALFLIFALAPLTADAQAEDPLVTLGRQIFDTETFNGNGRTCKTCHDVAEAYSITPPAIDALFIGNPLDPLFVADNDPALSTLENSCLLHGGNKRALFLENVDGFANPPVFRTAPHLFNVGLTAPYGQGGGVALLRDFPLGAITQHATKTLARVSGVDFRVPTSGELDALEAYMDSIKFPADGNLDLDRMIAYAIQQGADAAAIQRGRDLFFDPDGLPQCFRCHSGPALADADGSLGTGTGNLNFATGVVDHPANTNDGCSGGPGDPSNPLPPDGTNREFNTPGLVGIAGTGPYFHDNSAETLRDSVAFYATIDFITSPAGLLLPQFSAFTNQDTDDITAFLEAISVDPSPAVAVPGMSPLSTSLLVALLMAIPSLAGLLRSRSSTR